MRKSTLRNYIGLLSLLFLAVVGHSAVKETYGIFSQSLKVGGSTVAGSDAALEVQSTTKGVLFSPMTAVQRNAIGTPRTGLMVYNTDTSQYNYYNGTSWGILSGFANPMTTAGDLIVGGGSGSPGRLGIGATDTALVSNGSAASWAKLLNANIDTAAAIAHSKMAALTASRVLVSDGSGVVSASSVTSTTLGYLDVGSSLTTLLAAKAPLANPTFTGVVKVDDGSVSAPSYSFSNETNTGLYRRTASTLGISVAGTEGIDVVNIGSALLTSALVKRPTARPTLHLCLLATKTPTFMLSSITLALATLPQSIFSLCPERPRGGDFCFRPTPTPTTPTHS
jgi:hypothetical protein